jgi:hypothetical protein
LIGVMSMRPFPMLAWLLSSAIHVAALSAADASSAQRGVTHVKVFCKVYVAESGTPSNAEVTGTEPKVVLTPQTKEDVLSMSIYSRKFPVRFVDGKPTAGYRTVPVEIDFDTPVPLDHD